MFLQISTSDVFNFTIETGWMYLTITYRYLREKETTIRENRSKKTWLWTKLIKLKFRFSAVSRFFYDRSRQAVQATKRKNNFPFSPQVRFFLQLMQGDVTLPSKAAMLADTEKDVKGRLIEGQGSNALHIMGQRSEKYLNSLCSMMKNENPVPPVLLKIDHPAC